MLTGITEFADQNLLKLNFGVALVKKVISVAQDRVFRDLWKVLTCRLIGISFRFFNDKPRLVAKSLNFDKIEKLYNFEFEFPIPNVSEVETESLKLSPDQI